MDIQVFRHFEDADASSLRVELYRDDDQVVRAWYIGPLIRMAREFVLPFTPRERNLRAETAIARVVEIALAADLPVSLIDPGHLWDALWVGHGRTDPFSALLEPPAKGRRRRRHDFLVARDSHAVALRGGTGRDIPS